VPGQPGLSVVGEKRKEGRTVSELGPQRRRILGRGRWEGRKKGKEENASPFSPGCRAGGKKEGTAFTRSALLGVRSVATTVQKRKKIRERGRDDLDQWPSESLAAFRVKKGEKEKGGGFDPSWGEGRGGEKGGANKKAARTERCAHPGIEGRGKRKTRRPLS